MADQPEWTLEELVAFLRDEAGPAPRAGSATIDDVIV
jgi:hypothetical protein